MVRRKAFHAAAGVVLAVSIAACSGAGAPSPMSTVIDPTASPSDAVASTAPTAAPSSSPAVSVSRRPAPSIDLVALGAYLTSSITLIDLADSDLAVTVAYLDPASESPIDLGTYTLGSMDQTTNAVPPGTYRLEFRQPAASATGPSCTIEIGDEDGYVFAVVRDAVAISRTGTPPADSRELFIATSSLCVG